MYHVNVGISRTVKALQEFAAGLEDAAAAALDEALRMARDVGRVEINAQTHRRTGDLLRKISIRRYSKLKGVVRFYSGHAKYIDEGTVPHQIVARRAPFLVFRIGDRWIRKKSVQHPGTSPRPFSKPAREAGEHALQVALANNIEALKRRVGL